ncbi:MAG: hypothetical protein ACFCD0_08595 [Gemmataceae bacterium]
MNLFRYASVVLGTALLFSGFVQAEETQFLSDTEFAKLHKLIKRQPGESRWMEIDWHPNVWEARQKAAAEGKPIFIMAGSGGAPAAGC